MNWTWIILAALAGFAAGASFYGGLHWTLRRLPSSPHPALLTLSSFVTRTAIVAAALLAVGYGNWQRMLAATGGLIAARIALTGVLSRFPADKREAT